MSQHHTYAVKLLMFTNEKLRVFRRTTGPSVFMDIFGAPFPDIMNDREILLGAAGALMVQCFQLAGVVVFGLNVL